MIKAKEDLIGMTFGRLTVVEYVEDYVEPNGTHRKRCKCLCECGGEKTVQAKDLKSGKVFITSQNHGFTIDKESLDETDLVLTQINLNDGTPEGISHKELPLHCIQYHPEAGPGPNDKRHIFDIFDEMMDDY